MHPRLRPFLFDGVTMVPAEKEGLQYQTSFTHKIDILQLLTGERQPQSCTPFEAASCEGTGAPFDLARRCCPKPHLKSPFPLISNCFPLMSKFEPFFRGTVYR